MIKTIFPKVMWIGRATVFTVGLAVTLALMLGITTTALAAVPGDPFKLGKSNIINRLSALVGSTADAMLKVDNNGAGTALDLRVEPGKPPMKVNSGTQVANLNADRLDGNTAEDFYFYDEKVNDAWHADFAEDSGHADFAERANDSALLNGKNSTAFFSGETYQVSDHSDGQGGGAVVVVNAFCDPEDKALSGGSLSSYQSDDALVASLPIVGPGLPEQGWEAQMRDGGRPGRIYGFALCADFPPYRP